MYVWRRGLTPIYLGCSVHCQQSARTKSTNGGQVYNNTALSVCVCVCVCVCGGGCGVWRERVQCVYVEGER